MAFSLEYTVAAAIDFLGFMAKQTETKVDDAIVSLMKVIKDEQVVNTWFADFFDDEGQPALPRSFADDAPAGVRAAFERRGFDWSKVAVAIPVILQIISAFRK